VRLLVVGNGIAGSCVARQARARGYRVTVMADPGRQPAAKAALCVVRPLWFNGIERRMVWHALGWYETLGAITTGLADYSAYTTPSKRERRNGYFAIDPYKVLVEPDLAETYVSRPEGYDAVVLCLGAHADVDWVRTWGVTTVVAAEGPALRAHFARPREVLFAVCHDHEHVRFGSSVGASEPEARHRQNLLEERGRAVGMLPDGFAPQVVGQRLMPPGQVGPVELVGPGVWTLHGFGRIGFSFAPVRAEELLAKL
jgi:threonine dehydrogenase-like Zn-dependent dehydrogenase